MESVLDNPAWNALISNNKNLSNGSDTIKYFSKEVAPFVGLIENTPEYFEALYQIFPFDGPVVIISKEELFFPPCWKLSLRLDGLQMVYNKLVQPVSKSPTIISLSETHIPEMMALTQLTHPGPFSVRTIELGYYEGFFERGKLVAMAGQRLHCFEYAEISAVCTHPDYTGRGYARMLLLNQIHRIQSNEGIPFLHVRSDNTRAIEVYEDLGFETRTPISFYFLNKKE